MAGVVLLYPFSLVLCALIGYFLGSVNWGIILTKKFTDRDIREQGSGNAGMTNVIRTVGAKAGALTFVGDFLKCVLACLITRLLMAFLGMPQLSEQTQIALFITGLACVLGHIFPIYYGFRGGKAIVTACAMMLMTDWRVCLLIIVTFLIFFLAKRIISLGSVVCAALYPLYTFLSSFFLEYQGSPLQSNAGRSLFYLIFTVCCSLFVSVLVLWKHRANIGRLLRGEEKPIGAAKK